MKVFVSWSAKRSGQLAQAFAEWLPQVIQQADPFVSQAISPGTFWNEELRAQLADAAFAVVCVTSENISSPWLNYEMGALAERLKGRVVPWLLDVQPNRLHGFPGSHLQACAVDRNGAYALVKAINSMMARPLSEPLISQSFSYHWPVLSDALAKVPPPQSPEVRIEERLDQLEGLLWRCVKGLADQPRSRRSNDERGSLGPWQTEAVDDDEVQTIINDGSSRFPVETTLGPAPHPLRQVSDRRAHVDLPLPAETDLDAEIVLEPLR